MRYTIEVTDLAVRAIPVGNGADCSVELKTGTSSVRATGQKGSYLQWPNQRWSLVVSEDWNKTLFVVVTARNKKGESVTFTSTLSEVNQGAQEGALEFFASTSRDTGRSILGRAADLMARLKTSAQERRAQQILPQADKVTLAKVIFSIRVRDHELEEVCAKECAAVEKAFEDSLSERLAEEAKERLALTNLKTLDLRNTEHGLACRALEAAESRAREAFLHAYESDERQFRMLALNYVLIMLFVKEADDRTLVQNSAVTELSYLHSCGRLELTLAIEIPKRRDIEQTQNAEAEPLSRYLLEAWQQWRTELRLRMERLVADEVGDEQKSRQETEGPELAVRRALEEVFGLYQSEQLGWEQLNLFWAQEKVELEERAHVKDAEKAEREAMSLSSGTFHQRHVLNALEVRQRKEAQSEQSAEWSLLLQESQNELAVLKVRAKNREDMVQAEQPEREVIVQNEILEFQEACQGFETTYNAIWSTSVVHSRKDIEGQSEVEYEELLCRLFLEESWCGRTQSYFGTCRQLLLLQTQAHYSYIGIVSEAFSSQVELVAEFFAFELQIEISRLELVDVEGRERLTMSKIALEELASATNEIASRFQANMQHLLAEQKGREELLKQEEEDLTDIMATISELFAATWKRMAEEIELENEMGREPIEQEWEWGFLKIKDRMDDHRPDQVKIACLLKADFMAKKMGMDKQEVLVDYHCTFADLCQAIHQAYQTQVRMFFVSKNLASQSLDYSRTRTSIHDNAFDLNSTRPLAITGPLKKKPQEKKVTPANYRHLIQELKPPSFREPGLCVNVIHCYPFYPDVKGLSSPDCFITAGVRKKKLPRDVALVQTQIKTMERELYGGDDAVTMDAAKIEEKFDSLWKRGTEKKMVTRAEYNDHINQGLRELRPRSRGRIEDMTDDDFSFVQRFVNDPLEKRNNVLETLDQKYHPGEDVEKPGLKLDPSETETMVHRLFHQNVESMKKSKADLIDKVLGVPLKGSKLSIDQQDASVYRLTTVSVKKKEASIARMEAATAPTLVNLKLSWERIDASTNRLHPS